MRRSESSQSRYLSLMVAVVGSWALVSGCTGGGSGDAVPTFSLAWSEYPSWSVFGVADTKKLIDGAAGKQGPLEKKWGIDIELKQTDYDTCLTMYGSSTCDAVCITNMDVLNPALGRKSVAVLPTSTSVGADACIVTGIENVEALRNHKVYGLAKSVSEYCFVRNLEKLGEKEADHKFTNMDPAAAAQALQIKQEGYNAIMVWNPFVLQTLKTRPDSRVLFDSSSIPGEIIDMVVVAEQSLAKKGGEAFAHAVADAFYEVSKMMANPATSDDTLVALGAKFSNLGADEMKKVVQQTVFYSNPADGIALFTGSELPKTMDTVVDFCVSHEIVGQKPSVGYGGGAEAQLLFDPSYMQKVSAGN